MTLGKSCKYYLDSRCILGGGYCDLNCGHLHSDEEFKFYDMADVFARRRMEEEKDPDGSCDQLA